MKTYSAILVDDEKSALHLLEQKVRGLFNNIDIAGTFQDPESAVEAIKTVEPDLLFLDIEMPRMNGFELLGKLKEVDFQVIFITAYSEYALDAFKASAVDYILKPFDNEDLTRAVNKALDRLQKKENPAWDDQFIEVLRETISRGHKIIVPTSSGLSIIPEQEVLHLEGYDGYTKIHLATGETITSSYNLGKFEKSLGKAFFKCHKSHIVNLEYVRAFENEGYLVFEDASRVPISRANRKLFLNLFQ